MRTDPHRLRTHVPRVVALAVAIGLAACGSDGRRPSGPVEPVPPIPDPIAVDILERYIHDPYYQAWLPDFLRDQPAATPVREAVVRSGLELEAGNLVGVADALADVLARCRAYADRPGFDVRDESVLAAIRFYVTQPLLVLEGRASILPGAARTLSRDRG